MFRGQDYPVNLEGEDLDSLLLLVEGLGFLIFKLASPDLLLLGHAALAVELGKGGSIDELGIGAGDDIDVIGMVVAEGFGFEAVESEVFLKDMVFQDLGIGGYMLAAQAHKAVGDGIGRTFEVAGGGTETGGSICEQLEFLVIDDAFGVVVEAEGLFTEGAAAVGAAEALDFTECFSVSSPEFLKYLFFVFAEFFHYIFIVKRTVRIGTEWGVFHFNLLDIKI